MNKFIKLLTILIVVSFVGIYGFVNSGIFNVAATNKDGPIITWLLHTTMEKSVDKRAQDIEVPEINNDAIILAGLSDYVGMCAQCHGEPGKPPGILAQGLNPAPPNLEDLAEEGTAAEKFWVINNGIRMTGMAAFGKTHKPDEIWPVVAFLQSAKGMTSSEYSRMKKEAEAYGHHKVETGMVDKGKGQHHAEETNGDDHHAGETNGDHNDDTSLIISGDDKTPEMPPMIQKQANHAETQTEIQVQDFPKQLDSKSSDSTHGDHDSHSH